MKPVSKQPDQALVSYQFPYILKPTQEMYFIANHVISTLSTMENVNGSIKRINRGLALPLQVVEGLSVGDVFNSHGASSWSTEFLMARNFALDSSVNPKIIKLSDNPTAAVFVIENPSYGNDISFLSQYPHEREFLLGKSVRIIEKGIKDKLDPVSYFTCEIV